MQYVWLQQTGTDFTQQYSQYSKKLMSKLITQNLTEPFIVC